MEEFQKNNVSPKVTEKRFSAVSPQILQGGDDEEEEQETSFLDINILMEQDIDAEDIKRLKSMGINTIKGIQMCTRKTLLQLNGFNSFKVDKILEACCRLSATNCFITSLELYQQRKQIFKLSTGSRNLNALLGGGIESMAITEVFGEFRTGKTQLAHTLCVTAQIPAPGGYNGGKVIFIDTEHTFRPDRIKTIAEHFQLDPNGVLDNILYARAYNSEHQYELLNNVSAKFYEEPGIFKLLIIDSILALFRVDFNGAREMSERQAKLAQMLSKLQKLSEEYNVAVFMTNQITTDLNYTLVHDLVLKPTGGNVLAHASTTRVALKTAQGNKRIAQVYDSPNLEQKETEFVITSGGISDPKINN